VPQTPHLASRRWLAVAAFLSLLVLSALVGGSSPGWAQGRAESAAREQSEFASLEWRNIGPIQGGRATAVAGSGARPDEYYFGAVGAGLWKTTDGGENWNSVADGFLTSSSVGAVAVCETNPDVVYIGTGEVQWREWILPGDGVYKSTDGGETWEHIGLVETQTISRIRLDPTDCDRVYAAAMGRPFGPNAERGVFRSTDGGASWEKVLFVDEQTGAADLSIDPNNADVLYAGLWQAQMRPWGGTDAGPGSGLYKSTDGGDTWTNLTDNPGLPDGLIGKVGVAVGADSQRVYAIFSARPGAGVYASDDAGETWRLVNDHGNLLARPHYYTRVVADPQDPDAVWVLSDSLSKSTDGGATFERVRAPHADHHDLWIDPTNRERMINSNDGGANVSTDGGSSWTEQDQSTAQMYSVTTTNDEPYLVCGGQQENGTACVSSDSDGSEFFEVGGGETAQVAVDPRDSDVFYAGNYGGTTFTRFDRELPFQEKRIDVWPHIPFGHAPAELKERFAWSFPIVTTPAFPQAVYTSSQHLFRSTNGGQSWEQISPDLTRADPSTLQMPFGPVFFHPNSSYTYATITAVAPSPLDRRLIWVGSDDGLVHVTRNGGRTWEEITPPDMEPFTYVAKIDASPHEPGSAYLAAHRYKLDDTSVHLYRTDDFGQTWTPITNGIADGDFAYVVREDPRARGLLYAGTQHGVHVSFDNGDSWQSLQQNLPDTPVRDLLVKGDDLILGTFGRGFWVMDEIAPLREQMQTSARAATQPEGGAGEAATPTEAATETGDVEAAADAATQPQQAPKQGSSFVLHDPADPIRLVDSGVEVTYALTAPAEQVTLEFLDQQGSLIRSFSGEDVPVTPGEHSFDWDLRYPGPTLFEGIVITFASTAGPRAPWGNYTVRLTVDDESAEQQFAIKGDPRLTGVGPGAIREQFRLALAVRDGTSEANEGVIAVRDCRDQVNDRVTQANDPAVTAAGEELNEALGVVERALYQTELQPGVSWEGVEPLRLNNEIAYLLRVIESAESRPTEQTYDVFELLRDQLDARLAELDGIFEDDVAAFNELLQERGITPVDCSRAAA
jgi:photosystem II stability/assembly factor-like uncharacterized protein